MEKMNFTDNQTTFEYALYMIASSYFDKINSASCFTEKRMLLQYKEQKLDKQYSMEDICIKFMDRVADELPKEMFKLDTMVHLRKREGKPLEILFENQGYILCLTGNYAGKKSSIDYRILTKQKIMEK